MSYPVVTLDDREPPQIVDELAELGYEVEVEHLTIGDFRGKTTIGEIKWENDFFGSIVNKRLFNQAKRMHSTGKEGYLLIFRCEKWYPIGSCFKG